MSVYLFWAKYNCDDETRYHSLIFHALDTAAVVLELAENIFPPGKLRFWRNSFPDLSYEQSNIYLAFICSLHDIGKATPYFQEKNLHIKKLLLNQKLPFHTNLPEKPRHNFCSEKLILEEISDIAERKTLKRIAQAIGGHHGLYSSAKELNEISKKTLGHTTEWIETRNNLTDIIRNVLKTELIPKYLELNKNIKPLVFQYWLSGVITLSDWIASSENYFIYENSRIEFNYYFRMSREKAKIALRNIGFNASTIDKSEPSFIRSFPGYTPRIQQIEAAHFIKEKNLDDPFLFIVEAPMGVGKTEIAFLASETINKKLQQEGAYIAMPTQATSNQMYSRYSNFLKTIQSDKISIGLLHSASTLFLSDINKNQLPKGIQQNEDDENGISDTYDWFKTKKRGLLGNYAVGTTDQVLVSLLRTKHNYLRLFGLSGKVIIFDEVHSYDVYMLTIFKQVLTWAKELNISVIILSATLPKLKKNELIKAYSNKELECNTPYPRLTLATEKFVHQIGITPTISKKIKLKRRDSGSEGFNSLLSEIKKGSIAVICNTVSKAQQLYSEYKLKYPENSDNILLLHARLPADIRWETEEKVKLLFGSKQVRPEFRILFSTQIIEQSLDLDFDYMITDLCPIDLFLQRAGRLHRFENILRPVKYKDPEICWFNKGEESFQGKGNGVYSEYILYKTYLLLKDKNEIIIPDELDTLIEEVYGENSEYDELEKVAELKTIFLEEQKNSEKEAQGKLIPKPETKYEGLENTIMLFDDEDPENHPAMNAVTRLGPPSVKVAVVIDSEGKYLLADKNKTPLENSDPLDDNYIRAILGATVTISSKYKTREILSNVETAPPKFWRRNPALKYLRILKFENNICTNSSLNIFYNDELGVYYK